MCITQCGCKCGWTVKRFAHRDLHRYCKVSTTCQEHKGHGSDAVLPKLTHRGRISSDCRGMIDELNYQGIPQDKIIQRVRVQVQAAFVDDPYVDGGLEMCTKHLECY